MAKKLLNAKQVAGKLNISVRSVWRRGVDMGELPPPVRIGSSVRWDEELLDAWIEGGCKDVRKYGMPAMTATKGGTR
jgi:predicted DNA-binding transcriptional regulator AlpA